MTSIVKTFALGGAVLAVFGSTAFAADVAKTEQDWTGIYIGAGGGGNATFSNTSATGYGYADVNEVFGIVTSQLADGDDTFGTIALECGCNYTTASAAIIGDDQLSSSVASILSQVIGVDQMDPSPDGDSDTGKASGFATFEGGVDYQVGSRFVVGLTGAFNFGSADIKNSATSYGFSEISIAPNPESGYNDGLLESELQLGNSWSIGGRTGVLATDSVLLFASAGYVSTQAKLNSSYSSSSETYVDSSVPGEPFYGMAALDSSSSDDEWLSGYYVGGGLEALLNDHISLRMEYRYADLGSIETSADYSDSAGSTKGSEGSFGNYRAGTGVSASADPTVHSIRATVNWRF